MIVTSIYASILTLLFVGLSIRVIWYRHHAKVALGDAGNQALVRRIRTHGNFAEYAPMGILLMALAEIQNTPNWIIHVLGLLLLCGRAVHAYGVGRDPEVGACRVTGMALTFAALVAGASINLFMASIGS